MRSKRSMLVACVVMLAAIGVRAADEPRKLEAKVSPEAEKLLKDVTEAYGKLTSLEVSGTILWDKEGAGQAEHLSNALTASFQAPNKFRHEAKGNMIAGSTGEKAYAHQVEDNNYVQKEAPKDRVAMADAPKAVWDIVSMQNPSLAMALAKDAGNQLIDGATAMAVNQLHKSPKELSAAEVEKATEVKAGEEKIGDKTYPALKLTNPVGEFTFAIDPESHLLRRMTWDVTPYIKSVGQTDITKALDTVDYQGITPGAKVADNQFAWTPPANARELTAAAARDDGGGEGAAMALVGKDAPNFKLPDLAGKDVQLSDLKGSVVVVDFWATWCGPCVQSLPHLNSLYEEKKAAGLKVLAVSVDQDKAKVPPFVTDKKLTFTVLLDNDQQKAAEKYGVQGIPQTVVIGKDGKVAKVFIGFGPGSEETLKKAVEEAMK
jgi:peroxiredoxin